MDFPRNDVEDCVVAIRQEDLQRNREKFAYLKKRWDDLAINPDPQEVLYKAGDLLLFYQALWTAKAP